MIGKVSWTLYWKYFRSALPAALLMCLFVLVLFVQGNAYTVFCAFVLYLAVLGQFIVRNWGYVSIQWDKFF